MRARLADTSGSATDIKASAWPLSASKAGAMSSARRISNSVTSMPNFAAAASTSRNLQHGIRDVHVGHYRQTAQAGQTSRNSPSRLPARSDCWADSPVTLPPGRARLATKPRRPDRPPAQRRRDDRCRLLDRGDREVPAVTMTSTLRRTNSAVISGKRSRLPSVQRTRSRQCALPQPSSRERCSKEGPWGPGRRGARSHETNDRRLSIAQRAGERHRRRTAENTKKFPLPHVGPVGSGDGIDIDSKEDFEGSARCPLL